MPLNENWPLKYKKIIFWLFISVLVLQSIMPINNSNSKLNNTYLFVFRMDYVVHASIFLVLSVLHRLAYLQKENFSLGREFFYFGLLLFIAVMLEVLQLIVTYRVFNINDLAANIIGVILSIPLIWQIQKHKKYNNARS